MGSDALAESDLFGGISSEYVYFNGRRISLHGGSWFNGTSGPLVNRALGAAVAFIVTYDAKMQEIADQSRLVSDPNSKKSWINPFNYVVEPIGLVHGVNAALKESSDDDP